MTTFGDDKHEPYLRFISGVLLGQITIFDPINVVASVGTVSVIKLAGPPNLVML